MKFFDFGAFQKIMKMLSREKYIFHMLFGASHGTPRNKLQHNNDQPLMTLIPRDIYEHRYLTVKSLSI